MTEAYRFFGGAAGDPRQYVQTEFAEVLERFFRNGYFPDLGSELQVTVTDPARLAVRVATGQAWINGYYYKNADWKELDLEDANTSNDRIDRIVLRLDTINERTIEAIVKTGTPSASPTAPTLERNAQFWELSLATVRVRAGITSIANADITDTRNDADLCGMAITRSTPTQIGAATQAAVDQAQTSADAANAAAGAAQNTANSAKATAEKHAQRHAKGGADPLTPAQIGAATETALNSHVGNKNNPHDTTSEQITQISERSITDDHSAYPVGLTTMSVSSDNGWPNRGIVISAYNTNYRFGQIFIESRTDGSRFMWRDYHSVNGWTEFKEVANADALADLLSRYESHIENTAAHGATTDATPNTIMRRNSNGSVSVADATNNAHALNRRTADDRYARPDISNIFGPSQTFENIAYILDRIRVREGSNSDSPYLDIYKDSAAREFALHPAGADYNGYNIRIGRAQNRIDLPGGATIEGNPAWHGGNNPASIGVNSGYQRLASGLMMQWGSSTLTSPTQIVNLPIAFQNSVHQVVVTPDEELARVAVILDSSKTTFRVRHDFSGDLRVRYLAIGD